MFTQQVLQTLSPSLQNPDVWTSALTQTFNAFAINTNARIAAFLAQTLYESAYYMVLEENLNYSAAGLLATFPNDFDEATAQAYARQPEKIANRVYANMLGNGPEVSGDGWTFRGRGILQLTGRGNYQSLANDLKMDLADCVNYMSTIPGACMSAGWFWSSRGLNTFADANDFNDLTYRINGGYNGLAQRQTIWAAAQRALAVST